MKKYIFFLMVIAGFLNSCVSTQIVSSWREPDKTVTIDALHKVLVVALFNNEQNRHRAEDQMVQYLGGSGLVSYNYLDDNMSRKNEMAIRDKIRDDGFDGAVTMRLIDVDRERTYIPGNMSSYPSYYGRFSGYYSNSWNYYSTPGYYATTKTYTIEINVYSIKQDKIIWTGVTETTNPDGVQKLTEAVVKVVYKQMVKEGFIISN
jgi:hypothetical protein